MCVAALERKAARRRTPSPNSVLSEHQVAAVRFTNPLWHVEFSHMVGASAWREY